MSLFPETRRDDKLLGLRRKHLHPFDVGDLNSNFFVVVKAKNLYDTNRIERRVQVAFYQEDEETKSEFAGFEDNLCNIILHSLLI